MRSVADCERLPGIESCADGCGPLLTDPLHSRAILPDGPLVDPQPSCGEIKPSAVIKVGAWGTGAGQPLGRGKTDLAPAAAGHPQVLQQQAEQQRAGQQAAATSAALSQLSELDAMGAEGGASAAAAAAPFGSLPPSEGAVAAAANAAAASALSSAAGTALVDSLAAVSNAGAPGPLRHPRCCLRD